MYSRFGCFVAAAGVAVAGLAVPSASAQDKTPIKLGFAITQTGPYSPPALFELRGYELAVDQINQAGGLLGRPILIVKYDDQGNPSTAVQLYQKLLTDDKVDLLLSPYQADLVAAVAPIVNRAEKVMPSLSANVEVYSGKFPYLMQSITQTGRYMAPVIELAATMGYKTVALLVQNTQFPKQLGEGVVALAKEKGMEIVFNESFPPTTTDFSALVLKAGEKKPDVIIGATYLADAQGIVRAAKAQNVQAKMFAFSIGPVEPEFYRGLGTAAEQMFGTTLYFKSLKTEGNANFVAAFKAKYNVEPTYNAAIAYARLRSTPGDLCPPAAAGEDRPAAAPERPRHRRSARRARRADRRALLRLGRHHAALVPRATGAGAHPPRRRLRPRR